MTVPRYVFDQRKFEHKYNSQLDLALGRAKQIPKV